MLRTLLAESCKSGQRIIAALCIAALFVAALFVVAVAVVLRVIALPAVVPLGLRAQIPAMEAVHEIKARVGQFSECRMSHIGNRAAA